MVLNSRRAFDRFLLQVVDGGLAGVIFAVPLLMGGRHAIGQLVLTVLAVTVAVAWAVRQCFCNDAAWRPTAATPLVLIGLLVVVLQTVPLPPWLLAWLSPHTAEILPLWNVDAATPGSFGRWACISLAPAETLAGLVIFLDFILLFFVVAQRIRRIDDVEQLLRWCALSAVVMATFGIVQFLTNNGKFFWFYEHPFSNTSSNVTGSFTNRNHFAHFLALGIGPLIWRLQDAMRRTRGQAGKADIGVYLSGLALGIVVFVGLLSLSRGGIAAMFLAAAICTIVCYRTTSFGRRFAAVLAGAGVLIGVSLAIFGYDRVSKRLDDFSSGSLERLDASAGRRTFWANTLRAVPNYALLGAGVGSFSEVYPVFVDAPMSEISEPTHAENGYLQSLLETGIVGFGLILAGVVLCAAWCIGGIRASIPSRSRVCAGAIAGSLAASAAHSLVDFVWYVPACMAIVAILAACALRVRLVDKENEKHRTKGANHRPRADRHSSAQSFHIPYAPLFAMPTGIGSCTWPVVAATLACLGVWMISDRIGPAVAQTYWDEYFVACRRASKAEELNGPGSVPALSDAKTQERWIIALTNVVHWQPTHLQAHLKLLETHRRLFDILQRESANPMSLIQIGDAVFHEPEFQSRKALAEWLPEAIGPHWVHLQHCLEHASQALALCPLEGRCYVHIAELSFLWTSDPTAQRACIEQAMRVRPYDGNVLYAAGNQALLAGNESQWREYLQRAFRCGHQRQQQIMSDRVAAAPPESLPAVIDDVLREFQPDLIGTRFLHGLCKTRCTPEQLTSLRQYWAKAAEDEAVASTNTTAAIRWSEAQNIYGSLKDDDEAFRCAKNAFQCDSNYYGSRCYLGYCLLKQKQFAEAETHLRWCLQRTPDDVNVKNNLREALRGRLDEQRRVAQENENPVNR